MSVAGEQRAVLAGPVLTAFGTHVLLGAGTVEVGLEGIEAGTAGVALVATGTLVVAY